MAEVKTNMFQEIGTNVTSRKGFKPTEAFGYLCKCQITEVVIREVEMPEIDPKTGQSSSYEYAGHTIPTFEITFKQAKPADDPSDRFLVHRETIPVATKKDGTPNKDFVTMVLDMYKRCVHICQAFEGVKGYNLDLTKLKNISDDMPVKKRIDLFREFFTVFKDALVGKEEKPLYTGIPLWLKAIASSNGKYYTTPRFNGKGFIERVIEKQKPSLEFSGAETHILNPKAGDKSAKNAAVASTADEAAVDAILDEFDID